MLTVLKHDSQQEIQTSESDPVWFDSSSSVCHLKKSSGLAFGNGLTGNRCEAHYGGICM